VIRGYIKVWGNQEIWCNKICRRKPHFSPDNPKAQRHFCRFKPLLPALWSENEQQVMFERYNIIETGSFGKMAAAD
jgi:hypothetical protein